MARDRSQKPEFSGGGVSSDDLLKDAWQSMGRTGEGDRIEAKSAPSTKLTDAATMGQSGRTETAEEIAQLLQEEAQRRQPDPRPAPEPRRQAPPPDRRGAARPRRTTQAQPPPPPRRPAPRPRPQQQQQPQQRRSRRGLGWLVFAAFWLVSSLVGVFFGEDSNNSTPDIDVSIPVTTIDFSDLTTSTISATPGATFLNIRDVAVGQCIESLPVGSIVNDVAVVPCETAHQYELFANTQVSADGFPGDEVFALATEACIPLFASYVGEDYFDSTYYIDPIAPTEEGWNGGDRAVNCLLYSWPDGADDVEYLTESAEGTGGARS
ncbi:MAG: hypothetical protein HKN91_02010 [Acidimicrobiia bacterium]|nr:hypothetical protein [Acidimicrobiia bacterium]